ncbi:MAG: hypothetical protein J5I47_02415 [Vicingus serpentipes]|nr:hypothetical protein [Vicingus serpentipes]
MRIDLHRNFIRLFIISLIWLLLEGIFRKWLFFSLAGPLFYVKYLLFGLTYTFFIWSKNPIMKIKYTFHYFILLFVSLCFIALLINKNNNPIMVGIIGLVVHLIFFPLVHLNQFLFKDLNIFYKFSKILTYLAFPLCILGMIQFYLPTDHPINGFVNEEQLITRVAGFTRISSVFSFVKIFNAYLLFSITFLIGVILNKLLKAKSVIIESLALMLLITNMFMTGSRLPVGLMLFNFLIIGAYVFLSFSNLRKTVVVIFISGLISLVGLYFTTDLFNDPVDATIARFEKAESRHRTESTGYTDIQLRFEDRLDIFKFGQQSGLFGYGIGMAYQGAQGFIKHPIPFYFEEEGERIVLELGILGGGIVILMRLAIFFFALQVLRWCKTVEIKLLVLPLLLYILPGILTIQNITYSYMENFIYYFAIGLIIALYKIQQRELEVKH